MHQPVLDVNDSDKLNFCNLFNFDWQTHRRTQHSFVRRSSYVICNRCMITQHTMSSYAW